MEIEVMVPSRSRIGEGAVWDDREEVLWWVDIPAGLIHRTDPARRTHDSFVFGEPVGCLAVREKGGLVVAARSGFWFFDPATGAKRPIHDPETDRPTNRFNDGMTDLQGRFWAGTMKDGGEPEQLGRFYRLDPDLTVTLWKEKVYTANGMAFSPDGTVMYFSDSHPRVRTIWRAAYDTRTGTPDEPEPFFDTSAVKGRPDGGAVDAEGHYWQAGIEGWALYRLSPEGRVVMKVEMPVEKPTKPTFGGRSLDILFVTSMSLGLTEPERQPEAGSLFAVTGLGIRGVRQARFGG